MTKSRKSGFFVHKKQIKGKDMKFDCLPSQAFDELAIANPDAYIVLMALCNNKADFFKGVEHLTTTLNLGRRRWESARNLLIEKGYLKRTDKENAEVEYLASNLPIYK